MNLTGLPSRIAAATVASSSPYVWIFSPNDPPTSGAMICTQWSGTPSVCANTRWIMCGHWLLVVMVSLPWPSRTAQAPRATPGSRRCAGRLERVLDHQVGLSERRLDVAGVDRFAETPGCRQARHEWGAHRERARSSCRRQQAAPAIRCAPARRRPPPRPESAPRPWPTGSPTQQARSTAIGYCGADFMPGKQVSVPTHAAVQSLASSAPVMTGRLPAGCPPLPYRSR